MKKLSLEELNRLSVDEFKERSKHRIILVLDNIRSALNVGAFFRTADAFACKEIVLCGITSHPPHPEINKAAIGADRSMTWTYAEEVLSEVLRMKEMGVFVVGIEQTSVSKMLDDYSLPSNSDIALVFGNEVNGLSEEILSVLDMALEIPQYGTKHSLNVAVCGGVVIWDVLQKIKG